MPASEVLLFEHAESCPYGYRKPNRKHSPGHGYAQSRPEEAIEYGARIPHQRWDVEFEHNHDARQVNGIEHAYRDDGSLEGIITEYENHQLSESSYIMT